MALAVLFAAFMRWGEEITGGIYVVGATFVNVFNWIRNVGLALWESMKAIGQNIGIAFENAWIFAQNAFWSFVSDTLKGVQLILKMIDAVAVACGKEGLGIDISGAINTFEGKKQDYKSFVSVGDAWSKGYSTYDYKSLDDAYSKGYQKGGVAVDWLDSKISSLQGNISDFSKGNVIADLLEKTGIGNKFTAGNGLPNPYDSSNALGGAYDPSAIEDDVGNALKKLGNIEDNTDSLKLTSEDVEYLRKIAESEWKKEFTTAEIKVDMTNYNTINDKSDLDGIFTKLSEELLEELNIGADGVYA